MRIRSPLLAAGLAVVAAACGSAAAAPVPPSAVMEGAPPESVRLVERLAQRQSDSLSDVTGLTLAEARAQLEAQGLDVTIVRFGKGGVSAQWPDPGAPVPSDQVAVVWIGTPPTPPPAPAPARRTQIAPALAPTPDAPPPNAAAAANAVVQPQQPAPGGRTPGLENMVAPPHPPRANIRTLAPADSGTLLRGRASWYGPGFAGHQTACGGVFDPAGLTIASRELRCGTTVTVTGPGGRSVEATVTDWGPAEWTDRRFDLSQATFAAVAGLGSGVVDVTVEVR